MISESVRASDRARDVEGNRGSKVARALESVPRERGIALLLSASIFCFAISLLLPGENRTYLQGLSLIVNLLLALTWVAIYLPNTRAISTRASWVTLLLAVALILATPLNALGAGHWFWLASIAFSIPAAFMTKAVSFVDEF
jgi:hypothetical protein